MKLSIIVPVYNTEKYIKECIGSILSQAYTDFELILVDDGSTDSSGIICDRYAETDTRIRVIHKENEGQSIARNTGIALAKGEYILMLDSDDFIDLNTLEAIMHYADTYNMDCVAFGYKKLKTDGTVVAVPDVEDIVICEDKQQVYQNIIFNMVASQYKGVRHFFQSAVTKLYRRQLLIDNKLSFRNISEILSEDFLFNLDFFLCAQNAVCLPDTFYTYRDTPASTTKQHKPEKITGAVNLYNHVKEYNIIRSNPELKKAFSANIMGLISPYVKMLIASDTENKISKLNDIVNIPEISEMVFDCDLSKINFPLNLFCLLIKYKMKYTLYFMIKIFLTLKGDA